MKLADNWPFRGSPSKTMRLHLRVKLSFVLGAVCFVLFDCLGYDRLTIDLFHPRPFAEVWWHFPLWVAANFVILTVYRYADDSHKGDPIGPGRLAMKTDEIAGILKTFQGKRVRVEFSDGVTQDVDVASIDVEGFCHSGPDGEKPNAFWTRFENVVRISGISE
jgi:hypothetical protein